MHAYSTDKSRVPIYGYIAVLAVVLAWFLAWMLRDVPVPSWLMSAPSMAGVFTFIVWIYEKWGWRRIAVLVGRNHKLIDASGVYRGRLQGEFEGKSVEREITIRISQTWQFMKVEMFVEGAKATSESESFMGSIVDCGTGLEVSYCYRNHVNPGVADEDMGDHEGTAILHIESSGAMRGRYYNGRKRAGTIRAHLN